MEGRLSMNKDAGRIGEGGRDKGKSQMKEDFLVKCFYHEWVTGSEALCIFWRQILSGRLKEENTKTAQNHFR